MVTTARRQLRRWCAICVVLLSAVGAGRARADDRGAAAELVARERPAVLRVSAAPSESRWRWTRLDLALQSAYALALLGDYLQTRKITRAGQEMNPLMGSHGQRIPPPAYFGGLAAAHLLAMWAVPSPYRNVAQSLSIGYEAGAVGRNFRMGVGFGF